MKKTTILTLIAAAMAACTVFEPEPKIELTSYSIIEGDTVKTRIEKDFKEYRKKDISFNKHLIVGDTVLTYKAPKLHTPPAKAPDLSKLKNNDDPDLKGKPLRMVAIGGSLTAGVRDGGYFNEGMLTSYPNLIARQMGIKFEQPLFDADSYNGYGRKVRTSFNPTGGPVPKFKEVSNNSGVEGVGNEKIKLKAFKGQNLDCFCVPESKLSAFVGSSENNKINTSIHIKYLERILNSKKPSFYDNYKNGDFDFYLFEFGYDDLIEYMTKGGNSSVFSNSFLPLPENDIYPNFVTDPPQLVLLRNIHENNKNKVKPRGFVANIPNILDFPIFKTVSTKYVIEQYGQGSTTGKIKYKQKDFLFYLTLNEDILIPSNATDSLMSPKVNIASKKGVSNVPLEDSDVLSREESGILKSIKGTSIQLEYYKKRFGINIVDLYSLYEKIIKGNYVTEDGIRVDPSYPNGNFFSADGINPTAFGQAIVANEFIKTMNKELKMEIPLIPTAQYLNLK
jgi:hypothetical protein